MHHDIAANTKALCRVCMSPELNQPADLYDASSFVLPSLHEMLRLICAPVFEKPEADLLMPEMPTKVCLVCQNAVFAAYNLHQQCIETDRRLNELVALMWELQGPGGDEFVGDSEDPSTSSSQEVTLSLSAAKGDEIPKQNCIPCDSETNNTCSGCGKTFKSRWYYVRHKNQGWCDIQANCVEPSPASDLPAPDRDHLSDGVRPVENNSLLNTDAVNTIKVETLEVMDQNDSDDLLQEATLDQHIECSKCGISFSSIRAHRKHVQAGNCQRTSTYPCTICGKIFDTHSRMRYHIYTHRERVACPQCDDTFRNRNGLLVHIRRKRCSGIKLRKTGQNVSQISQASSTKEQNQHVEQDQTQREETKESLVVEMPTPEGDSFAKGIKTVDMQCGDCGVTFSSSRAHKMHVRKGNCQQKPTYPCKICGKIFDTQSRMNYHYYSHKERFPCSMCNAKFRSEKSLQKHLKQKGCSEEHLRCSEMYSSPTEGRMNDPLIEQTSVTDGSSSSGAFGDPLLNIATLEMIKVEEPEIAETQDVETQCVETQDVYLQDKELQGVEPQHADLTNEELEGTEIKLESGIFVEQNCGVEPDQTPASHSYDLCEETFESAIQLANHENNHGRFFCHQCGYCWRSKGELRKHIAKGKCLGTKARTCLACKKVFETAPEYKKHRQEAHPGPVNCPDCGRRQASLITLRIHVNEGRCENLRNRLPKGVYPRTCKICGELKASVSQLRTHMRTNHLEQIYPCKSCVRHFPTQKKLNLHMEKHAKNLVNICQTCKTGFPSMAALKRHKLKMHVGPVNCTVCQKLFTSKSSLKMHMTIHTGQKTYACGLCPKRFRTSLGRKHHLKSHSNEPAAAICACDICEMKFTSTQTLKIHKRTIHEGLRPFACTTCNQKFGRPQHLRRHMRTHTKEKPFKCAICPHAYIESSELVRHVAREHGDGNPYACDRCDKTFRFIAELRKHYADHYQAGDDTTGVEELGWKSMALLNMRFAKEQQQQKAEDDEDSE